MVYLAEDLKHHRPVALKVLRPDLAAALGPERFLREIDFAARLSHPNILPLYDSEAAAGTLFYVMPFVESGTLRDRLARGPVPSVAEALGIARQIAAALTHAHAGGVVHRDIKPGNILLSSEHVFVADFGIARAVREAVDEERLTGTGLVLGTPSYMAPEQLAAAGEVDHRADQYSLACVLYELLLGHPPGREFRGTSAARRSIQAARPDLPPEVAGALARALSLDPEGRYPAIEEFAAAFDTGVSGGTAAGAPLILAGRRIPAWVLYGLLALVPAAFLLTLLLAGGGGSRGSVLPAADTSRYAILPVEAEGEAAAALNAEDRLHDAFSRWNGISLADGFQVRDAVARKGIGVPLNHEAARAIAREVGAGRYIRTKVTQSGDSLRVEAVLYDLGTDSTLYQQAVKVPVSQAEADSQFAGLAGVLLFRGTTPGSLPRVMGTRSVPARQAFVRGQEAILAWNLASADTAFARAASLDQSYAAADLWLALVRAWSGQAPARWRFAAEQALAGRAALSSRDQQIAQAIAEQARGEVGAACPRWMDLTRSNPQDFVAWYGSASCLAGDDAVVRDSGSPSGWRFRTSYQAALAAYRRAFGILPTILQSFSPGSFSSLRRLFKTNGRALRQGYAAPPDSGDFLAYAEWQGDTLTFVPQPAQRIRQLTVSTPPTRDLAVRRQWEVFHGIVVTWVTAQPRNASAMEALALSLELLGDPAALDTLRAARRLAQGPGNALRIAGAEVWLRVRLGVSGQIHDLEVARRLADSLLADSAGVDEAPGVLARLALLTGRAARAASLIRIAAVREEWAPMSPFSGTLPALLVFASLGGPQDSLSRLEALAVQSVRAEPSPATRERLRTEWLARAATLAMPDYQFRSIASLRGLDWLLDAQTALLRGDTNAVLGKLASVKQQRAGIRVADLTIDALYPEAALLVRAGRDSLAVQWLDPTLQALRLSEPDRFADPARPGSLVRALILRARLAERMGNHAEAAKWAARVVSLWSDADGFLQPAVKEMRRLARLQ